MSDHKSFLKWAGGKIKLLPKLRALGIERGERFIEPFVGSGVVSLNMPHPRIIIGDTNEGLISLWDYIKSANDPISHLRWRFSADYNTEEKYYEIRTEFNNLLKSGLNVGNGQRPAALFLYLNKHCFNGLCRYNAKGEFNVPFNHRKTPPGFPEKELLHAIEVSKRMAFPQVCSFVDMFRIVKSGDMVYCDPPYLPLKTTSFVDYSKAGFTTFDHGMLADCAIEAQVKGATVIISNNNTADAKSIYRDADELHFIDVQKNISCKGDGRGKQSEVIAVYRPK